MPEYPTRGHRPWDEGLKAYIDAGALSDEQRAEVLGAASTAAAAHAAAQQAAAEAQGSAASAQQAQVAAEQAEASVGPAAQAAAAPAVTAAQQSAADAAAATQAAFLTQDEGVEALLTTSAGPRTRAALRARTVTANVMDFGAVGDGITDDTAAFQAAVDDIRAAGGGTLLIPPRTYVVRSVSIQAGLTISGYGATLLRPANAGNWVRTLTTQHRQWAGATDAPPIVIRGLTIDGNSAQQGPYKNYELQQAMHVLISGDPTQAGRQVAVIDDVTLITSTSDGVHVWHNADVTLRNVRAVDCFRGGITMSGGNSITRVYGYVGSGDIDGAHIDHEIDTPGYGGTYRHDLIVSDASILSAVEPLQVMAYGGAQVTLRNVTCNSGIHLDGGESSRGFGSIRVDDCSFVTFGSRGNQIAHPADIRISRTTFTVTNATGSAMPECRALDVLWDRGGNGPAAADLRFESCEWLVGTSVAGDVRTAIYSNAYGNTSRRLTIDGGSIDAAYDTTVRLERGGSLTIGGGVKIGSTFAMRMTSWAAQSMPVALQVGTVTVLPTCSTYLWSENAEPENVITHDGTVIDEAQSAIGTVSGARANTYRGRRVILVSSPPTAATRGLLGDVCRLKAPAPGATYEWICTTGFDWGSDTTWKPLTTLGS